MAIRKRTKIHGEFGLSAMTDIIFMLLIFFILTSTVSPETILKVVLPKGVEDQHLPVKPIRVYLDADGNYAVNENKTVTFETLSSAIEQELSKDLTAPISIHADKSVRYEQVMEMVRIANQKSRKVVLALEKE
jgi:biopolymer transport protein ExbD